MTTPPETQTYKKALELTQKHHLSQSKTFSGQFTWKQRFRIKEIIDRFEIESILDYGCGKLKQYLNRDEDGKSLEEFWGITSTKYDPGIHYLASDPVGIFDLVICIQVLGSIPLPDLPRIVDRLYGYGRKAIFVVERLQPPKKMIYREIEDQMPRGLSVEDWARLLHRPNESATLIALFKNSEYGPGWHRVEIKPEGDGVLDAVC